MDQRRGSRGPIYRVNRPRYLGLVSNGGVTITIDLEVKEVSEQPSMEDRDEESTSPIPFGCAVECMHFSGRRQLLLRQKVATPRLCQRCRFPLRYHSDQQL